MQERYKDETNEKQQKKPPEIRMAFNIIPPPSGARGAKLLSPLQHHLAIQASLKHLQFLN